MENNTNNILTVSLLEFKKGNKKKAILSIKNYLVNNPHDEKARQSLAYMYVNSNMINNAIKEYKIILNKNKNLEAMFGLAICFSSLNKFAESEKILLNIIKTVPNNFKALRALGDIYFNLKDLEKALKYLNLAKKLIPNDPILLNSLGVIEMKRNNFIISENYFLESIKNKKNYKNAFNNLAALYQKIGNARKSLEIYSKLLIKFPKDKYIFNNIGNVLVDLNKFKDAIKYLNKAIKIDPDQSSFYSNLGRALLFSEKYKDAQKNINRSLHLNSKNYEAHLILFYLLIIKKDLKNAWKHFDSRLYVKNYFIPNNLIFSKNINNNKTIILKEAGLGDEILYSSMYPELIKKNDKIVIECDKRLINIFKHSFNYENFVFQSSHLRRKSNLDKFKSCMYAGSLTGIFRNRLSYFNNRAYLRPNIKYAGHYSKILKKINKLPKIGISWISKRLNLGEHKSIDLEELLPILKIKNLSFVNLQYGNYSKKIDKFNKKHKLNIIDIIEIDKFNDIDKLLALISELDLVLTVSNTTAHLSGAIGKKTFLLAPDNRAQLFYWMFSKERTPWYPSIKIFKKKNNWESALKDIQLNLNKIFSK